MGYFKLSGCLLALLSILPSTMATCPSECTCTHDRHIDCSGQDLSVLPYNIQENAISLNLSHNRIKNLDNRLTNFSNLRILDISSNQLSHIPSQLPLALWEFYAANNHIKILQKQDTVSQWNLKILDVSNNLIERAFLINNTLISLTFLNFSGNRFWTVPTNMPSNLTTLDLSHNNLQDILRNTFRQDRLSKLYLNNNSFKFIPNGSFDQLTGLQLITLYGNLWECHSQDVFYLLTWIRTIKATVLGCPCTEETICSKKGASTSDPSTATLPSHASAFTRHQIEITTVISTRHQETEGSTFHSPASQETGSTPFSQLVTNTSLNSSAPSSVRQPVSQVTTQNITIQTMASTERPWNTTSGRPSLPTVPITAPEFTSDSKPLSQVTTQNIAIQTMASTEKQWNMTSVTANTSSRPSSSTMSITAPEFTSDSTVLTNSTTMANNSNGTVNSQTSGSITLSTFEPTSSASHRPTVSTAFSTASEPSTVNLTTSHAATRNILSTIQTGSTSLTTGSKIQESTGTTSSTNPSVTTAQNTTSTAHVHTGITLYLIVLNMLVSLVV